MSTDWKGGALETAVTSYVAALTGSMTEVEVLEAQRSSRVLFRHDLDALGELSEKLASPIFLESVRKKVSAVQGLNLADRRVVLGDDTFLSRLLAVDDDVRLTAERVLTGERLTPETKSRIEAERARLNQLAQEVTEHPRVAEQAGSRISEALLDCRFILDGGEPTSFRLNHFRQSLKPEQIRR